MGRITGGPQNAHPGLKLWLRKTGSYPNTAAMKICCHSRRPALFTDQMIQAARSGKQNILEGSQASGTSKETEMCCENVATARAGGELT
jgi:hypothetical protein